MKLANAPCSWGVLEFGLDGDSVQYETVLDEMKETGYSGTELGDWGFMPTDAPVLRAELARRQISLVGAFVPIAFADRSRHLEGEQEALRTSRLLAEAADKRITLILADANGTVAARTRKAGRIGPEDGLSTEQWSIFADGVHRVAAAVQRETGLSVAFHHHCAGYVETPDEIDTLLDLTDPDLVGLCFDTGHYQFGGGDPVQGLQRLIGRITHVHLKDCSPVVARKASEEEWDYFTAVRNGVFCELGKGGVDFSAVISSLTHHDYCGWLVVEQDVLPGMGTPKESARRNRKYLSTIGL